MKLPVYQIDAFAEHIFEGNPAAVIPLDVWLDDKLMQAIAAENNLSETAFFVPTENGFYIRWFSPAREVKLCGHATLASAFVLFNILGYKSDRIEFDSLSGILSVAKQGELLTLDFPAQIPVECEIPEDLIQGLGVRPIACLKHTDYIAVFDNEEIIAAMQPNHDYLKKLDLRGVCATAPGKNYDFVSRFFAPRYGIPEDPVTGSAHTQLTPYWAEKLNKTRLSAKQISARGGKLQCELSGDRILISGKAVKYLEGSIEL